MKPPLTKEELIEQQNEIQSQIEEFEEQERQALYKSRLEQLNEMRENKDFLLGLIEHTRTSCDDDNVVNGFHSRSDGGYRCSKCALIELLDMCDEDAVKYSINFSVCIG